MWSYAYKNARAAGFAPAMAPPGLLGGDTDLGQADGSTATEEGDSETRRLLMTQVRVACVHCLLLYWEVHNAPCVRVCVHVFGITK